MLSRVEGSGSNPNSPALPLEIQLSGHFSSSSQSYSVVDYSRRALIVFLPNIFFFFLSNGLVQPCRLSNSIKREPVIDFLVDSVVSRSTGSLDLGGLELDSTDFSSSNREGRPASRCCFSSQERRLFWVRGQHLVLSFCSSCKRGLNHCPFFWAASCSTAADL